MVSVSSDDGQIVMAWYCEKSDNENGIVTKADDVDAATENAKKAAASYGYTFDQCKPLIKAGATSGYQFTTGKSFP